MFYFVSTYSVDLYQAVFSLQADHSSPVSRSIADYNCIEIKCFLSFEIKNSRIYKQGRSRLGGATSAVLKVRSNRKNLEIMIQISR